MIRLQVVLIAVAGWLIQAQTMIASPLCLPPAAPDAGVMRAAPEECLLYVGWNGAGKPDAKSENQTEQLLAEEEVQKFLTQIDSQVTALVQQAMRANPMAAALADHVPVLVKTILTRPAALYVSKVMISPMGQDVRGGIVVNTGDRQADFAKAIAQLETLLQTQLPPGMKFEETNVGGATLKRFPTPPGAPAVVWGFKDTYFLISVGLDTGQELVGRLTSGAAPAWLTKVQQQAAMPRPGVTWYANVAGILQVVQPFMTDPQLVGALEAVGIKNVSTLSSVSGFDGTGMAGKMLIASDGELKGLLAALAGKPLTASDLQPIPKDASIALAARLDLSDVWQRFLGAAAKIDPQAPVEAKAKLDEVSTQLGFSMSDDLFAALGDVWCVYQTEAKAAGEKSAPQVDNVSVTVAVRDRKRMDKCYPALLKLLQSEAENSNGSWTVKQSTFRGNKVYYVPLKLPQAPTAGLGFNAPAAGLTPCWCLTNDRLVVSSTPQALKDFLTRDAKAESLASRTEVAKTFSGSSGPSAIIYLDIGAGLSSSYPMLQASVPMASFALASQGINVQIPALPSLAAVERHLRPSTFVVQKTAAGLSLEHHQTLPVVNARSLAMTGVGGVLLVPATQKAREAAQRTQSTNNLKQIGLALNNFAAAYQWFPAAAGCDKEGKPLLSWRVYILPFVEQQELYNSFKLDEPWDSEHNKALIARMPIVYRNPDLPQANEGKTNYLAVVGDNAAIRPKQGTAMTDITDGTSNTIMVVEASPDRAVIWTKPDDFSPDEKNPAAGLGGSRPGIFLALFADASVQAISLTNDPATLKALFTRNGGEVIAPGAIK
jgi:hypothetical protein